MSEQKIKDQILSTTFRLFSEKGIYNVALSDISQITNYSEKRITEIFRTKEELVVETGKWKMEKIGKAVDEVVALQMPLLEKYIKYLEVMYENLLDTSFKLVLYLFAWQEQFSEVMNNYLKKAVYGRFASLVEQASSEGMLRDNMDAGDALYSYWEMLSGILAVNLSEKLPIEMMADKPMSNIVCSEIVKAYRNTLKPEAAALLNQMLSSHPVLSKMNS